MNDINIEEWHNIRTILITYFKICPCQRKLKSIIDNLVEIKTKCIARNFDFTGAEWLLLAILNSSSDMVMHGVNCEYPIININHTFWKWIDEVKDNVNLIDN